VEKIAAMQNQKDLKELQLKALQNQRDIGLGLKHQSEQDRLEQQAKQGLTSVRGDQALQRVEAQRDASIQAYNTIEQLKKENRMPSQIEYYDLLGQMWKARTGASPTDQAVKDLDAKTFKGSLAHATQYFTGKPAGMTTGAILQNIQNFAKQSGLQADKMHGAYMGTRLVKPKNLEDDRWAPLAKEGRGMSFSEATGANNAPMAQPNSKTIGGKTYIQKDGKWFEQD